MLGALVLGLVFMTQAPAFETGVPLSFTTNPATVRQRGEEATAKIEAIVMLKEPAPAFFVCQIRSHNGDQVSFPAIVFRKGDTQGKSEGIVHWKAVRRDARVRLSAFNADAPDRQLSFTVVLKPVPAPDDDDQPAAQ